MSDELDPGSRLYYEGSEFLRQGRPAEALAMLINSLELSPHGATARRIATALEGLGRQEEADTYWHRAYELASNNDPIAVGYAGALHRAARTTDCEAILKEVLRRNPSYGPASRLLQELGGM